MPSVLSKERSVEESEIMNGRITRTTNRNSWPIIMKNIFLIASFIAFIATSAIASEPDNYCKDQGSWAEWQTLIEKYPDDNEINALYALRLGLCTMLKNGTIDHNRAVHIFEGMRNSLVEYKRLQKQVEKENDI